MLPVVERSIEIKASPRTVWSLIASQEGLRRWFDRNMEIEMQVGGAYRFCEENSQGLISGYVLEIVPEERLVLSWLEDGWIHPTRLTFTLEPIPGGTRVTQRYDGFAGIGHPTWERAYHAYNRGIEEHGTLSKLKAVSESTAVA